MNLKKLPKQADQALQRAFLIDRLAPRRGERILDLGCGSGRELEDILRHQRTVRVVGLDSSERMIDVARRRLSRYANRGRVELVVGDAGEKLPFPSKHFDAVLSVELIECLPPAKRTQLLKEIRRVLKPGGRVLIEHTDWDTQVWNVKDKALARKLVHAFCDWTQGWMATSEGWMGRRLLGLFREAGCFGDLAIAVHVLTNDRFQPRTYGYHRAQDFLALAKAKRGITLVEARRFLRDLKARHEEGAYFYSVTRYVVTGVRNRR